MKILEKLHGIGPNEEIVRSFKLGADQLKDVPDLSWTGKIHLKKN